MGNLGTLSRARQKGLMMFGQMTAGSWIYIGTQGILQAPMRLLQHVVANILENHPSH